MRCSVGCKTPPDTAAPNAGSEKNALTVSTSSFKPMPSMCSRAWRLGNRAIAALVGNTNQRANRIISIKS
jgi:hypothetical protein